MEDDTPEAPLMNVSNDVNPSSEYGLLKSRNLFLHKDRQRLAVLSSGKWLQIVKNSRRVSCEVSTSPCHFFRQNNAAESRIRSSQSEKMHEKVISISSKISSSPSIDFSQRTLQFTMRANGMPRFVFKLENQKDIYVASLSSNVKDQTDLNYSYMIHLQRGESSSSSHLVGTIKILPCRKKNRGLSKKVVGVTKNNQSISKLRCSWDQQFQEPSFENNLPPNLETLAVVVKEEYLEEKTGGWGVKFLKKSSLVQTESESSRSMISLDVVIPSGIHGGPDDGPLSLIERWKSEGNCDCGGWDLGCPLTLFKGGQPQKDHCNLFELFTEGSKHETPVLTIMNVRGGLFFVQFKEKLSVLQSFSIALSLIHSQSKELRPLLL